MARGAMPVHDARYVSGPGDFSGVKSMRFQHQSYAQAGDPNDDPSAHDEPILAKFPGSREKDSAMLTLRKLGSC